jgi:predicted enzyme related to lactoylglutathione lyase
MSGIATLSGVALDCPDPMALARFYSDVSGWAVSSRSDDSWAQLDTGTGNSWALAFQRVADYRPPAWPGQDVPQQFHLDFDVPDLDAGEKEVLALGATKADHQPGTTFRVFIDPAGHPFCLCQG